MKKLILIPLLFVGIVLFGQRVIVNDSIPYISGADTTVYVRLYAVDNWSISFDYSALDDVDDTLDLGGVVVNDGTAFNRLDDWRLPFIMADSTQAFEKSNFSFVYLAIKVTLGSSTEGTIYYTINKR